MRSRVHLEEIESLEHEPEVLARARVPVLTGGTWLDRLTVILARHGVAYTVRRLGDALAAPDVAPPARPRSSRRVFVLGPVPAGVVRLATALFGGCYAVRADASRRPWSHLATGTTVVLLVAVRHISAQEAHRWVRGLTQRGCAIGIFGVDDPLDARFLLLKSLLIDSIHVRPNRVLFLRGERPTSPGAPPALVFYGDVLPFHLGNADYLSLSGHSNPLDMALGTNVLCSRKALWERGPARFPCFGDGTCFRQSALGRDAGDTDNLVGANDLNAALIHLSGCNTASLGRSWHEHDLGMVVQLVRRACVTAIASIGEEPPALESDFLVAALLAEGRPVGEAVCVANDHRRGASSVRAGPLVALGNPLLRVTGLEGWLEDATDKTCHALSMQDPHLGTVARIHSDTPAPARVHVNANGLWCLGALLREPPGPTAYLWMGATRPTDPSPVVRVRWEDETVGVDVRKHLLTHGSHLDFWGHYLGACAATTNADMRSGAPDLEQWDAVSGGLRRLLAKAVAQLAAGPDEVVVESTRSDVIRDINSRLEQASESMMDGVLHWAVRTGTLQYLAWGTTYHRRDASAGDCTCLCGDGLLTEREYISADRSGHRRVVYSCARCGPVGEDDGRRLLSVTNAARAVVAGSRLGVSCRIVAPADERLLVSSALVVECYNRQRHIVMRAAPIQILPGEAASVDLMLGLPADLAPGSYVAAVIGVLNGALSVHRWWIEIRS